MRPWKRQKKTRIWKEGPFDSVAELMEVLDA